MSSFMLAAGELAQYQREDRERLRDPEFAAWLQNDYVPIAGGWQY